LSQNSNKTASSVDISIGDVLTQSDLSSLKVSKEWDICWRSRKRLKCPLFLVREGPKNSKGVRGHAPPGNLLNSLEMRRRARYLSFRPFLLGASMLLWSAWANTRDKKIDRTRTDWTLAEVHCQWRNEFGIHEHLWKLKNLPEQCQCVRNVRVGVRAWDCIEMSKSHAQCVRLESSAQYWLCAKVTAATVMISRVTASGSIVGCVASYLLSYFVINFAQLTAGVGIFLRSVYQL